MTEQQEQKHSSSSPSFPTCPIPSIDLGPFFEDKGVVVGDPPTQDQLDVAATIDATCKKHGFVCVANLGISSEEGDRLFSASEGLFSNPSKHEDYLPPWSPATNQGFSAYRKESLNQNRQADLKEAFNIRFAPVHTNPSLPKTPESFRAIVEPFTHTMKKAAIRYGMACGLALNLPVDFVTKKLKTFDLCTARFLHNPPCDFPAKAATAGEENPGGHTTSSTIATAQLKTAIRVGEHTDFGAYTFLLLKDGQGPMGLQVKPGATGGEIGGPAGGEDSGGMDVAIQTTTTETVTNQITTTLANTVKTFASLQTIVNDFQVQINATTETQISHRCDQAVIAAIAQLLDKFNFATNKRTRQDSDLDSLHLLRNRHPNTSLLIPAFNRKSPNLPRRHPLQTQQRLVQS